MLSANQQTVHDAIMEGKNVVWLDRRQTGRTFLGHEVAKNVASTAYIVPSRPMMVNAKHYYPHIKGLTYFYNDPVMYFGHAMAGYQLIVLDNLDYIPEFVLDRVYSQMQHRVQVLAMIASNYREILSDDRIKYLDAFIYDIPNRKWVI